MTHQSRAVAKVPKARATYTVMICDPKTKLDLPAWGNETQYTKAKCERIAAEWRINPPEGFEGCAFVVVDVTAVE